MRDLGGAKCAEMSPEAVLTTGASIGVSVVIDADRDCVANMSKRVLGFLCRVVGRMFDNFDSRSVVFAVAPKVIPWVEERAHNTDLLKQPSIVGESRVVYFDSV